MNRSVESDVYDRYACIKSSADLGESMGVSVVSVLFMVNNTISYIRKLLFFKGMFLIKIVTDCCNVRAFLW